MTQKIAFKKIENMRLLQKKIVHREIVRELFEI
jgi:hypothetical protein